MDGGLGEEIVVFKLTYRFLLQSRIPSTISLPGHLGTCTSLGRDIVLASRSTPPNPQFRALHSSTCLSFSGTVILIHHLRPFNKARSVLFAIPGTLHSRVNNVQSPALTELTKKLFRAEHKAIGPLSASLTSMGSINTY